MKYSRNITMLAVLLAVVATGQDVRAQSRDEFDAYVKQQRQAFDKYKTDRKADFNRYREQCNREFAEYLKKAWKQVMPNKKVLPPPQPKPFVPKPTIDDNKLVPNVPKQMPVLDIVKPKIVPPSPKPIVIEKPKEDQSQRRISVKSFYRNDFMLRCSNKVKVTIADNTPSSIATAWKNMATAEFDPLVYDCQQARKQHCFCDWMYYQFIKEVAVDWDDTQVLEAEPGDYITIARKAKNSDTWFVGAITDENSRTATIDLSFLDKGNYTATIYKDGKNAHWEKNPQYIA